MSIHLECLRGAHQGRRLMIRSDKPLTIKTQKSDEDAGEIQVELRDGLCLLTNRSRMLCTVNGKERGEAMLSHGDEVVIGKQIFRVAADDADEAGDSTQQVTAPVVVATPERAFCSVCDAPYDDQDQRRGWSDGARRICRACLSKGVGPEHLPRPAAPPPAADEPTMRDVAADRAADTSPIDEPAAGAAEDASTTTAPPLARPPARGSAESDRVRKSRRISASRLAQVDAAPAEERGGLLRRVGSVFGGSREDRKRLELLEAERAALLQDAGRRSLRANGGFGLADNAMAVLMQGAPLTVRRTDLSLAELEQWRALRDRHNLLDAEIQALRRRLKLGPDPSSARRPSQPLLRTEQAAHEQRAFKALDDLGTADLADDDVVEPEAVTPDPAPRGPAPAPKAETAGHRPASRPPQAAKPPARAEPSKPAPVKPSAANSSGSRDAARSHSGERRKVPRRRR